jgi:hypothetical protein
VIVMEIPVRMRQTRTQTAPAEYPIKSGLFCQAETTRRATVDPSPQLVAVGHRGPLRILLPADLSAIQVNLPVLG